MLRTRTHPFIVIGHVAHPCFRFRPNQRCAPSWLLWAGSKRATKTFTSSRAILIPLLSIRLLSADRVSKRQPSARKAEPHCAPSGAPWSRAIAEPSTPITSPAFWICARNRRRRWTTARRRLWHNSFEKLAGNRSAVRESSVVGASPGGAVPVGSNPDVEAVGRASSRATTRAGMRAN